MASSDGVAAKEADSWQPEGNCWSKFTVRKLGPYCSATESLAVINKSAQQISEMFPFKFKAQAHKNAQLILQILPKGNSLVVAALVCSDGVVVVVESRNTCYIVMLASSAEGNGNGRRLIHMLEERCKRRYIKQIIVSLQECISRAAPFYERCGFDQGTVNTGVTQLTYEVGGKRSINTTESAPNKKHRVTVDGHREMAPSVSPELVEVPASEIFKWLGIAPGLVEWLSAAPGKKPVVELVPLVEFAPLVVPPPQRIYYADNEPFYEAPSGSSDDASDNNT